MKKFLLAAIVCALFSGCAHEAQFNKNADVAPFDDTIGVDNSMQSALIYIPSELMEAKKYTSSSQLGRDDELKMSIGEFVGGEAKRFFGTYLRRTEVTSDEKALQGKGLVITPEIGSFGFGFYSSDGIDVSAKPFVRYNLRLKMFKNGRQIYNQNIAVNERNYGEEEFFGSGSGSYAQIGGIFQKAMANDYAVHAREILDVINDN
ncbi:MAG: hypothetical protein HXK63_05080 [Campylobacter sp.]|nr:hypothetical protein [Campylobacter sp.]